MTHLVREPLGPSGAQLLKIPTYADWRGRVSVVEFEGLLPFLPRRYFVVFDVPDRSVRGEHAHRECHQFLVSISGEVAVSLDDGVSKREVQLSGPDLGLYLPPRVWASQHGFSPGAALLVLASHPYSDADYIRDYEDFRRFLKGLDV